MTAWHPATLLLQNGSGPNGKWRSITHGIKAARLAFEAMVDGEKYRHLLSLP